MANLFTRGLNQHEADFRTNPSSLCRWEGRTSAAVHRRGFKDISLLMRSPMARKPQFGFTLLEVMAAMTVLLIVTAIVMSGMGEMMNTQGRRSEERRVGKEQRARR